MARILLVDDDLSVRTVVSLMLARGGHTVDVAASGEEALVLAGQNPPDLALSDLCMPGMYGDEVLARIRQSAPSSVCVLMTGDDDRPTFSSRDELRYLKKPFSMVALMEAVDSALASAR